MAQRPVELRLVRTAIGPVNGRWIKQAQYEAMESPTGIEDALEISGELHTACLHRVIHQHLGIAQDGHRRCAQFLPNVGNKRPLRSAFGAKVSEISRSPTSLFHAPAPALAA
jgi:hypothetical protein